MKHRGAPARRRGAAALERLVSCRGPAVLDPSPYERSASLFPTLISMIATEPDELTRDSALRIIGLLGAIEPLQYRAAASKADTAARQLALRESGSAHDVSKQGVTGDAATAAEGTEANAQQLEPAAADGKAKPDETMGGVVADGHAAAASQLGTEAVAHRLAVGATTCRRPRRSTCRRLRSESSWRSYTTRPSLRTTIG